MERRDRIRSEGDPLLEMTRRLQDLGGSLHCNIPSEARNMLRLRKGDDVAVEVHDDRLVIRPQETATDGGE